MTNRRIKVMGVLMLMGVFPASAARIFHLYWLGWIAFVFVAVACSILAIELSPDVWRWIREPKRSVVQTESKAVVDEYLRLGWTLKREYNGTDHGEPTVYLLEWLREGEPVRLNEHTFVKREAATARERTAAHQEYGKANRHD